MIFRAGCSTASESFARSAPISRRRLDRDDEKPGVGEQSSAVRLDRIGLLEAGAVASQKLTALVVAEPLQERLQGRAGEPIGDTMGSVERMNVGRHPDLDLRSVRPQPI